MRLADGARRLDVQGLTMDFGGPRAVDGVDLCIGANGAGKSTLLMSICGVTPPLRGEILFRGQPIQRLSAERIVGLGICQVPEGRRIFPRMSVLENLEMGAYRRRDNTGIKADIGEIFSRFPILAERRDQPGGTLSGGEQQMLAISRALLARPNLLLLDEPSLGLAPLIIKQIFDIIRGINTERNTTVFLVEQNANQALKIAHRGYVMENGVITLEDRAENLQRNERVKQAYLGM